MYQKYENYAKGENLAKYVYKPDMKHKSLMNLVYLWLHNEKPNIEI
jgi:hypothetical protein